MRQLTALAALAACSTQPTELVVTAPVGTTNVEVMLARACYDSMGLPCGPGIAWPGLVFQPPGEVFELDRDARTLEPYTGKQIRIRTKPGSGNVDRLVLVAFGDTDNMLGLVRLDEPPLTAPDQVIHVDIPPVDEVLTTPADPPNAADGTTFRAHVWRPMIQSSEASCAATQTWDATHLRWEREFYVPPDDHDCDQLEPDCAPDWADYGTSIPSNQSAWCAHTTPMFPRACQVGTEACLDGSAGAGCADYAEIKCVPDEMCDECPLFTPGCGAAMIEEQVIHDPSRLTFASCNFTYDDNNNDAPCTSNNADTLDLALVINCSQVTLYRNEWPPTGLTIVPFSTIAIGTANIQASLKKTQPCTLEFKFGGTAPATLPAQRYILGILNGGVEMEVPFSIRFSASCQSTGQRSCTAPNMSDGMFTCATQ